MPEAATATAAGWSLDADALPCGWLRVGSSGRLLATNRRLRELLGRPEEVLDGARIDTLLAGSARVLYHSYLLPLLRLHGRVEEFALALRAVDARPVDMLVYGHALPPAEPDGEGVIELVLVPMRERRRLEDELLRVRRAAEMAPGVIFQAVASPDGLLRMPYASEAVRALYGLTPDELARDANALLERIHPDDRAAVAASLRDAAASGTAWHASWRVQLPGRAMAWHEGQAVSRLAADGSTIWHGYLADVSARRVLEATLGQKEAAESASRAKSEFLARISHELRTPLNGILGFARLLSFGDDAGPLSPAQRAKVEIIENAGRQLLQLIDEVLDITRIEQGRVDVDLRPLALRPVLEEALALVGSQALAAGVELAPLVCDPQLAARADRLRLAQVLANLLSNAIKYNRRGGRVVLAAADDGRQVRIAVSDTGPGLDLEQQRHLFEPFNRLGADRSATEGTGLGLVITRQLVELMGGRMVVDSAPGRGSIFSVLLEACAAPRPAAAGPAPEPPRVPPRAVAVAPAFVLYAEDNPVNALLMEALFELRPGLRLQVVGTGEAFVAEALRERPDLLLVDQHLPDANGIDLVRRLRHLPSLAGVPAVMVSADAMPEDIQRAHEAGCADYWTKPLDVERTLARVDALLAVRRPAP